MDLRTQVFVTMNMFGRIPEFYEDAKEHEDVFRNMVRDLGSRVDIVPKGLDPDLPLDGLLAAYSPEDRSQRVGKFSIIDFRVGPYPRMGLDDDEALISVEDIAALSGSGYTLKYLVNPDKSVRYEGRLASWRS